MQIFDTHTHLNVEEFAGKEQEEASKKSFSFNYYRR